jgi:hypothetical protein
VSLEIEDFAPRDVGSALAPGRIGRVEWTVVDSDPPPPAVDGKIEYLDIAGLPYETKFRISRDPIKQAVVLSQKPIVLPRGRRR